MGTLKKIGGPFWDHQFSNHMFIPYLGFAKLANVNPGRSGQGSSPCSMPLQNLL